MILWTVPLQGLPTGTHRQNLPWRGRRRTNTPR